MTNPASTTPPRKDPLPVQFDPMILADLPEVARLEKIIFSDPWSENLYRNELLSNDLSFYWVLRPEQNWPVDLDAPPPILGYCGYWVMGKECHIVNIATHPDWLGRGLGRRMMDDMLARMVDQGVTEVTLEVRAGNAPAIALYTQYGFIEVGRRRRDYADGEDALLLTRHGVKL